MAFSNLTTSMVAMSSFSLAFRLFFSLAIILGAGYAIVWAARRRGVSFTSKKAPINIVGKASLSRRSSVVLLEVGDRQVLVGVTDQSVTALAEGDDLRLLELEEDLTTGPSDTSSDNPSFADALATALKNSAWKSSK